MHTRLSPRLRTRFAATALALLAASTLAGVANAGAGAAAPASAAEIICRIGPSLQGPASEEGIGCAGGGDASASGYKTGSAAATACLYAMNTDELPAGFLDFTSLPYIDNVEDDPDYSTVTRRHFYPGYSTDYSAGAVEIRTNKHTGAFTVTTSQRTSDGSSVQVAHFDCVHSSDGFRFATIPSVLPASPDGPTDVTAPTPSSTATNPVSTTDSISPLPGRLGEYLLRLNVTNNGSLPTYASVGFDRNDWTSAELLSSPAGTSCPVLGYQQLCTVESVAPGATATLVFHVTAGTSTSGHIPVLVANMGSVNMKISEKWGSAWMSAPFETQHFVALP